jgi:hypothetical protein
MCVRAADYDAALASKKGGALPTESEEDV